jgi:hypothetical protein
MSLNKYPWDITTAGIVWRCSRETIQQNDVPMVVLEISHCHGISRGCHDIQLIVADCGSCVPVPTLPTAVALQLIWIFTNGLSDTKRHSALDIRIIRIRSAFELRVVPCCTLYTQEPFAPSEMLSIRVRKAVELVSPTRMNADCSCCLVWFNFKEKECGGIWVLQKSNSMRFHHKWYKNPTWSSCWCGFVQK